MTTVHVSILLLSGIEVDSRSVDSTTTVCELLRQVVGERCWRHRLVYGARKLPMNSSLCDSLVKDGASLTMITEDGHILALVVSKRCHVCKDAWRDAGWFCFHCCNTCTPIDVMQAQIVHIEDGKCVHMLDCYPEAWPMILDPDMDLDSGSDVDTDMRYIDNDFAALFAPDGSSLLILGQQSTTLWNVKSGIRILAFGFGASQRSVAFSHDSTRLFVVCHTISGLWCVQTGRRIRTYGGMYFSTCTAFSPDGVSIVTCVDHFGEDGRALLWDVETGELTKVFDNGHNGMIKHMSCGGRNLFTVCDDDLANIWCTETRTRTPMDFGRQGDFTSTFSADDKYLFVVTGASMWRYCLGTSEVIRWALEVWPRAVTFCLDRSLVVSVPDEGDAIQVYCLEDRNYTLFEVGIGSICGTTLCASAPLPAVSEF